jgi:hypothetical protein
MEQSFDVNALKEPVEDIILPAAPVAAATATVEPKKEEAVVEDKDKLPELTEEQKAAKEKEKPDAAAATDNGGTEASQADKDAAAAAKETKVEGPTPAELKAQATAELLKKYGLANEQELEEKLKPKVELTAEEQKKAIEQYEADLNQYAVKHNLLGLEEIKQLHSVTQASDEVLARARFESAHKVAQPDATPEQIDQAYKLFYHLDSEVPALKALGEQAIKTEAQEVRQSLQSKMDGVKEVFDDTRARTAKVPAFKALVQSSLKEFIPEQLEIAVTGDDKVVYKIDPAIETQIEKSLVSDELFNSFYKQGNTQPMKELLKAKIESQIHQAHRDAMFKTIYDAGVSKGLKEGSGVGATAPFGLNKDGTKAVEVVGDDTNLSAADNAKLARIFGGQ